MKRIIVLTSHENFALYSMQEIVPYLEASWQNIVDDSHEVILLNIDVLSLAEITPKLIGADRLVISCFNYRMCKVMQYIREILKLNLSFIIHVHNLATIGFWPYRYFGSSDLFVRSDVFITSCQSDSKLLQQVLRGPTSYIVPLDTQFEIKSDKTSYAHPQNLIYVGKISPQKNLHNLLLGYALLKKQVQKSLPPLLLFGDEDHLGSPNMGIRNENYLSFLKNLTKILNIEAEVQFHEAAEPDVINDVLKNQSNIFVSPSLKSDENFGIFALHALICKNKALLSDWGGHPDLKSDFPESIQLMPVTLSEYGPTLSAEVISNGLMRILTNWSEHMNFNAGSYYSKDYYNSALRVTLVHEFDEKRLLFSELANKIYEVKMDYTTSPTRIFSNFTDPLFHEISKSYIGTTSSIPFPTTENIRFYGVPWLTFADEVFMVDDPQKGPLLIASEATGDKTDAISLATGPEVWVSRKTSHQLFTAGYINQINYL